MAMGMGTCARVCVYAGKADEKNGKKTWRSELAMVEGRKGNRKRKKDVKVDEGKS